MPVRLAFTVDADFADLFEVRGKKRDRRGRRLETIMSKEGLSLGYEGLDEVERRLTVHCVPAPTAVRSGEIEFETLLAAGEAVQGDLTISCEVDRPPTSDLLYEHALVEAERALQSAQADNLVIMPSNERFTSCLHSGRA